MTAGRSEDPRSLGEALVRLARMCPFGAEAGQDPVRFPRACSNLRDREIVAFVAASLAYGRRDLFLPFLQTFFSAMGNRPWLFVKNLRYPRDAALFRGMVYRFNSGVDVAVLLEALRCVLQREGGLEAFFLRFDDPADASVATMVRCGLRELRGEVIRILEEQPVAGVRNPLFLLPDPDGSSALKRPFLFFRWMVRNRPPDPGGWKAIPPSRLVLPLDVHLARFCRNLGILKSGNATLAAALEATRFFRDVNPEDPLLFDFPLLSLGAGSCPRGEGPCQSAGSSCPLAHWCARRS